MTHKTVTCNSCNVLVINNVICHEFGCPDKWENEINTCKWCGAEFKPHEPFQLFCSTECGINYCT